MTNEQLIQRLRELEKKLAYLFDGCTESEKSHASARNWSGAMIAYYQRQGIEIAMKELDEVLKWEESK